MIETQANEYCVELVPSANYLHVNFQAAMPHRTNNICRNLILYFRCARSIKWIFLFNGKICMYADFVTRVCTSKKRNRVISLYIHSMRLQILRWIRWSCLVFFRFLKSKIEATHNNYRIIDHKLVADVRIYNVLQFIGFDWIGPMHTQYTYPIMWLLIWQIQFIISTTTKNIS